MSVRDAIAAVEACESPEDLAAIREALAHRMRVVAPSQDQIEETGLMNGLLSELTQAVQSVVSGISDPGGLPWPEFTCMSTAGLADRQMASDQTQLEVAWCSFMAANEVLEVVTAYDNLRKLCNVADDAFGNAAFGPVMKATCAETSVPENAIKLLQHLADRRNALQLQYPAPNPSEAQRVVISGAGPCGLRAAVEAALLGMRVHVAEKRATFSRVNILMLWPQTADDMVRHGARACSGF